MENKEKFEWVGRVINALITISIFIISAICLIGMISCIISFMSNQQSFNKAYTDAINIITSSVGQGTSISDEAIFTIMTHMENLQIIQKNSATNDMMSFVYGILSTILVGLCAGFVAKSKKSADESKETAKQAEKNAKTVENTKKDMLQIKKDVLEEMKKAREQIEIQKGNTKLLEVHIAIAHAKMSLSTCNQVDSNSRIYSINKLIKSFDNVFDSQAIKQLRNELLILKSFVDEFKSTATQKYTNGTKLSMSQSASRYYKQLDESICLCDKIISNLLAKQGNGDSLTTDQ